MCSPASLPENLVFLFITARVIPRVQSPRRAVPTKIVAVAAGHARRFDLAALFATEFLLKNPDPHRLAANKTQRGVKGAGFQVAVFQKIFNDKLQRQRQRLPGNPGPAPPDRVQDVHRAVG